MKVRQTALNIPKSNRFFNIDIPGKGLHHFKCPYYGVISALTSLAIFAREQEEDIEKSDIQKLVSILPYACAVIGACWSNRSLELETQIPFSDLSATSLSSFGNKVSEELQDNDYNLIEILDMFNVAAEKINEHQSLLKMAEERAVFLEAPTVL